MKARLRVHAFADSGTRDAFGRRWCRCQLPERHKVHDLPPGGDDARRAAAGDRDEQEESKWQRESSTR